jgi:hypothetical protein
MRQYRSNGCGGCGCGVLLLAAVALFALQGVVGLFLASPVAMILLVAAVVAMLLWGWRNTVRVVNFNGAWRGARRVDPFAGHYWNQQTQEPRRPVFAEPEIKSPYETLGIAPGATPDEISVAYRQMAKQYHPDRVTHLGPEFRAMAEERMKEINAAYQELNGR